MTVAVFEVTVSRLDTVSTDGFPGLERARGREGFLADRPDGLDPDG